MTAGWIATGSTGYTGAFLWAGGVMLAGAAVNGVAARPGGRHRTFTA